MGHPYREAPEPEPAKPHPYVPFIAHLLMWLAHRGHLLHDPKLIDTFRTALNAAVEERHDLHRRIAHLERRLLIAEHTCGSAHIP